MPNLHGTLLGSENQAHLLSRLLPTVLAAWTSHGVLWPHLAQGLSLFWCPRVFSAPQDWELYKGEDSSG